MHYLSPQKYIGRAKEQVIEFLNEKVNPVLKKNKDLLGLKVNIEK